MLRSRSSSSRPPRLVAWASSASGTTWWMPYSRPGGVPAAFMDSHSDSLGKAFVQPDEVTEGYGELHGFRVVERIDTERVLESRHDDREAQRIQPRLNQLQLIGQRRERSILLPCDLLELSRDRGLHRHLRPPPAAP